MLSSPLSSRCQRSGSFHPVRSRGVWGGKTFESSTVQLGKPHCLCNGCCDCTYLIGLRPFFQDPVQHLKQLSGIFLAIYGEIISDLLLGLMDIKISATWLEPLFISCKGNAIRSCTTVG